jgi:hypothetical protein
MYVYTQSTGILNLALPRHVGLVSPVHCSTTVQVSWVLSPLAFAARWPRFQAKQSLCLAMLAWRFISALCVVLFALAHIISWGLSGLPTRSLAHTSIPGAGSGFLAAAAADAAAETWAGVGF